MSTPLRLVLALTLCAAPLTGQIVAPGIPTPPSPWTSPLAPNEMPGVSPIYKRGFQGMSSVMPEFQGFPTFPPSATGYGGFPRPPAGLVALPSFPEGRMPPPAPDPRSDWPSWIRLELEAGTGAFAPSRAVMVRGADRVWYLAPGEPAFVPLAYYDKVRVLEAGSQIQVRDQGEFQVSFYGGSHMLSHGPIGLKVQELSDERIALEFDRLTRLRVECRQQPVVFQLPDSSLLLANWESRGTDLFLLREGERLLVHNWGPGRLTLRSPLHPEGLEIPPDHRVTLWLAPHRRPVLSGDLELEGSLDTTQERNLLNVKAGPGGGSLVWSGARIRIPEGGELRLDPLSGAAFPGVGDRDR